MVYNNIKHQVLLCIYKRLALGHQKHLCSIICELYSISALDRVKIIIKVLLLESRVSVVYKRMGRVIGEASWPEWPLALGALASTTET